MSVPNVFFRFLRQVKKRLPFLSHAPAASLRSQDLTKKHVLSVSATRTLPSWKQWKQLPRILNSVERRFLAWAATLCVLCLIFLTGWYVATHRVEVPNVGGEYTEGLIGAPQFINPLYASASDVDSDLCALVYSGLMRWDPDTGLALDLADSLEISEDHKTYTFHIRDDAKWHDGEDVRASDVVFTVNSIQNAAYRSPLAVSFAGVGVSELSDKTVQFSLSEPFAPFLSTLVVGVMPAHIWQQIPAKNAVLASLNLEPVGSGPYQFEKFSVDKTGDVKSYTLARNRDYYGSGARVETLTFKFYADTASAANALENRNIEGMSFVPSDLVEQVEQNRTVTILRPSIPRTTTLFFNQEHAPFLQDDDVRLAIATAINKQAIVDDALQGHGNVINAPILPGSIGYHPDIKVIAQDAAAANALLDGTDYNWIEGDAFRSKPKTESDEEDGEENAREELALEITTVDQAEFIRAAEILKEQLAAVGMRVDVRVVASETFYDEVLKDRTYDALLTATQFGIDPDPYPFWHSSQVVAPGLNLARYANRNADKLLEEARQTTDDAVRAERYRAFQDLLVEDLPAVFLFQSTYTYAIASKIQNVKIERLFFPSDRFANVTDWYIKTKKALR